MAEERLTHRHQRLSRRAIHGGVAGSAMAAILAACGGSGGSATDTPKSATTGTSAAGSPAVGSTAKPAVQGTPVVVEGKSDGAPVTGGSLTIAYADVPTLDPRVSGATD